MQRSHRSRERRLAVATGLNVAIVVAQVFAGLVAGSVGLLADAGHNLADTAAVVLSLFALRLSRRGATDARSFGYHRTGILAAQANAAALLAVTALLAFESLRRLADPVPVDGAVVLVVALGAAAINGLAAWVVHEPGGTDLNLRSAVLHLVSDALVSVAVALAGAVILLTDGLDRLDPAVSLLVSGLIAVFAVRLLRSTTDVLLESTPAGLDVDALRADVLGVPGVLGVHDVHVWSLSEQVRAASGHVLLEGHPTLEEANETGARVKRVLAERYGIGHATLELECEVCQPVPADACTLPEPDGAVHRH